MQKQHNYWFIQILLKKKNFNKNLYLFTIFKTLLTDSNKIVYVLNV